MKNFKKFPKRILDQSFYQLRIDYIDKNVLKDICIPEDIVLFGALILKVKLHSKILTSKQNKISIDLILKNIMYAIPGYFLDEKGNQNSKSQKP